MIAGNPDPFHLAFAEQRGRANGADWQDERIHHFDANRASETLPFFEAGFCVCAEAPSPLLDIGKDDNGAGATSDFTGNFAGIIAKFKSAQESSPSQSPVRST